MRMKMELGIVYGWTYEGEKWYWVWFLAGHMKVKTGTRYVSWLGI